MFGTPVLSTDSRCAKIRAHPKFLSWVDVAPLVWLALLAGWLCVLISALIGFQFPSSGAVLVCSAVLSELAFERLRYRSWPRVDSGHFWIFGLFEDANGSLGLASDSMLIAGSAEGFGGPVRALLSLSKDDEWNERGNFRRGHVEGACWVYSYTIGRVEKIMTVSIVVSAVVGTLIWGYGHCLFRNCMGPM